MKHNKLVRDKIPEIIETKGENPLTHIADAGEYWKRLKEKLMEEVEEFLEEENIEEMADIFEVATAINKFKKWDMQEIIKIQKQKVNERGGFEKRIILEEVN